MGKTMECIKINKFMYFWGTILCMHVFCDTILKFIAKIKQTKKLAIGYKLGHPPIWNYRLDNLTRLIFIQKKGFIKFEELSIYKIQYL